MTDADRLSARGIRVHVRPPEHPDQNWRVSLDDECGRFAFDPSLEAALSRLARHVFEEPSEQSWQAHVARSDVLAWMWFGFVAGLLTCFIAGGFTGAFR